MILIFELNAKTCYSENDSLNNSINGDHRPGNVFLIDQDRNHFRDHELPYEYDWHSFGCCYTQ